MLLRIWRRFDVWMMHRATVSMHGPSASEPYYPSNLNARRR
jgi:hypothetical protein